MDYETEVTHLSPVDPELVRLDLEQLDYTLDYELEEYDGQYTGSVSFESLAQECDEARIIASLVAHVRDLVVRGSPKHSTRLAIERELSIGPTAYSFLLYLHHAKFYFFHLNANSRLGIFYSSLCDRVLALEFFNRSTRPMLLSCATLLNSREECVHLAYQVYLVVRARKVRDYYEDNIVDSILMRMLRVIDGHPILEDEPNCLVQMARPDDYGQPLENFSLKSLIYRLIRTGNFVMSSCYRDVKRALHTLIQGSTPPTDLVVNLVEIVGAVALFLRACQIRDLPNLAGICVLLYQKFGASQNIIRFKDDFFMSINRVVEFLQHTHVTQGTTFLELMAKVMQSFYRVIVEVLGFSPTEQVERYILKVSSSWANAVQARDILKEIWSTIGSMVDMFREFIRTGDYGVLFGSGPDGVLAEASFLLGSDKHLRVMPSPLEKGTLTYDERIKRTEKCLFSLNHLHFPGVTQTFLTNIRNSLSELLMSDRHCVSGSALSFKPFIMVMCGGPAVGKTTLAEDLNLISLNIQGIVNPCINSFFKRNANSDAAFFEGPNYNPGVVNTFALDEWASQPAKQGNPNPLADIMQAGDDSGFAVNRAFEKSNNMMRPKNVFLMTNSLSITNLAFWTLNEGAAFNRIDYAVRIEFKKGFEPKEGETRGNADTDYEVNRTFVVGKYVPNIQGDGWVFRPLGGTSPTHRFTKLSEFVSWFSHTVKLHYENGQARASVREKTRDHPPCNKGNLWSTHGIKCCVDCDFEPLRFIPKKTPFGVLPGTAERGSIVVNLDVLPALSSGYWCPISNAQKMIPFNDGVLLEEYTVSPPEPLFAHVQSLPNVDAYITTVALLWFVIAYYCRKMAHQLVVMYTRYFLGVITNEAKDMAHKEIADYINHYILDVKTKARYATAMLLAVGAVALTYALVAVPVKTTTQMDGELRHEEEWPTMKGVYDDVKNPPKDAPRGWGMAPVKMAEERILGDRLLGLQRNMVYVRTSVGRLIGNYITPNIILVNSHIIPNNAHVNGVFEIKIDEKPYVMGLNHFARHPTKDLAVIRSPEVHPNSSLMFQRATVRSMRKHQCKGSLIFPDRVEVANWRPSSTHVHSDFGPHGNEIHFQKDFVTNAGDCGAVALTDGGEIFGIHTLSGGGAIDIEFADLDLLIRSLNVPKDETAGLALSAQMEKIFSEVDPPSKRTPFAWTYPFVKPVAKLRENVNMNSTFATRRALAHDEFCVDLINTAGEPFVAPDCSRRLDEELGYAVRGEERNLLAMKPVGIISLVHLDRAGAYITLALFRCMGTDRLRPLTPKETFRSLKASTSAGYPQKMTKDKLIDEDGYIDESYELAVIDSLNLLACNILPTVSSFNLKDEPRKLSKVKKSDIRVFEVLGVINVAGNCLCMPLQDLLRKHPLFGFMVGLNCVSQEWGELYNDLAKRGTRCAFFLDAEKYDKRMDVALARYVATFMKHMALAASYADDDVDRVYNVCMSVSTRFLRVFGELGYTSQGNPSGSFLTTHYNMIVMLVILVSTWMEHYPQHDFFEHVTVKLYGDDSLGTVDEGFPLFNQISIKEHAAQFYGHVFTSGRKDGKLVPYENLEDGIFLKRSFNFRDGYILCPLEKSSIFKMLCWRTPGRGTPITDEEHFAEVAVNALREAFLHDREFFEMMRARLHKVAVSYAITVALPQFEEIDALYARDELRVWDA